MARFPGNLDRCRQPPPHFFGRWSSSIRCEIRRLTDAGGTFATRGWIPSGGACLAGERPHRNSKAHWRSQELHDPLLDFERRPSFSTTLPRA